LGDTDVELHAFSILTPDTDYLPLLRKLKGGVLIIPGKSLVIMYITSDYKLQILHISVCNLDVVFSIVNYKTFLFLSLFRRFRPRSLSFRNSTMNSSGSVLIPT
jgi:hypothetical protein